MFYLRISTWNSTWSFYLECSPGSRRSCHKTRVENENYQKKRRDDEKSMKGERWMIQMTNSWTRKSDEVWGIPMVLIQICCEWFNLDGRFCLQCQVTWNLQSEKLPIRLNFVRNRLFSCVFAVYPIRSLRTISIDRWRILCVAFEVKPVSRNIEIELWEMSELWLKFSQG